MSDTLVVELVESLLVQTGGSVELVVESVDGTSLVVEHDQQTITVESDAVSEVIALVEAGPQGPPGSGGSGEDEVPYSKRVDFVGETTIYRGEAVPGTPESAAAWRVRRLTLGPGDDVTEEWAGGSAAFDKIWANRAGYSYS